MQFCHALDCLLLQEILLENRTNGYTEMLKVDLSDGFYRINLNIEDIPKLGVIFPSSDPSKMLEWLFLSYFQWDGNILLHPSALLPKLQLILPTPSHPECSLPTSTAFLRSGSSQARLPSPKPSQPQLIQSQPPPPTQIPANPMLTPNQTSTKAPYLQGLSLPSGAKGLQYIDVFVDDFIALCQGTNNHSRV